MCGLAMRFTSYAYKTSPCGQMDGQVNEEQVLLIRVIKVGGSRASGVGGGVMRCKTHIWQTFKIKQEAQYRNPEFKEEDVKIQLLCLHISTNKQS